MPEGIPRLTASENTRLMPADDRIISHYKMFKKERGGTPRWMAASAPQQGSPVENSQSARENGALAQDDMRGESSQRLFLPALTRGPRAPVRQYEAGGYL